MYKYFKIYYINNNIKRYFTFKLLYFILLNSYFEIYFYDL